MVATTKKIARADRQLNRAQYAPKQVVKPRKVVRDAADVIALKKLTVRVLDGLKNPSAIPSQVIMDALIQARSL